MQNRKRCDGCGAQIIWAFTENGKAIPLDAAPIDNGGPGVYRFVMQEAAWIDPDGNEKTVLEETTTVVPYQPLFDGNVRRYMNHFATCPNADWFRRGKGKG